jgi:dipeptidyl aminopeptidase/acylaminoacyl peptidase
MSRHLFVVLVIAGCSGTSKPAPVEVVADPDPTAGDPGTAPAPPPIEANADPTVPTGGSAARDAELATKVAGYIDAFNNWEPVLTRDGKRTAFLSNRDGLPQLYLADVAKPAEPPTRLVTTTERVTGISATKDGKAVLFMSDTGADEHWSYFRIGLDGKDLVELTPGVRLNRDGFVLPDRAPGTMLFTARTMSDPKSTLYTASTVKPGDAKAIYTDDKPAFIVDAAEDGKAALVVQFPTRVENYLIRVDVATGKPTTLYPADRTKKVSISDAKFAADDRRVYVATDGGEEQALVLALDAKTGKVLATHEVSPPSAQVESLAVAKKGGAIALSVLVGNHSEVRLLDGKKLTPKATADLPLGQGFATEFSADGKRLVAQWSTPRVPQDIYAIDVKTGKSEALRRDDRPSLAGMPVIEATIVDIPAFDGGKIPTNVYMPAGEQGKQHPVMVVYHGGPSGTSVIRWSAATAFYLSLGYVVVEPNVRGSSGFGRAFEAADNGPKRLDAFKDIETSGRWVAAQPWADKDRLVVLGGSYGGYTVLIALSRWPDLWRAGVNLFGLVNLKTFMATTSGVIRQIFLDEFGDPDKDAEFLASISPLTDVDKIVDPTFVYAGANDPRVPRTESDLIVKALRQRGVATEYMVADNEGHSLARRENQVSFYSRSARFLESFAR